MSEYFEEDFSEKKTDYRIWKKILRYARPYKKSALIVVVCMLLVSLGDVLTNWLTGFAVDKCITPGSYGMLPLLGIAYFADVAMMGVLVYVFIIQASRLETNLLHDIRRAAFIRLQQLDLTYYDRTKVGSIMSRLTSDAPRLSGMISWSIVDLVWGVSFMLISLVGMFLVNAGLALIVFVSTPVLALISYFFQRAILRNNRRVRKLNSQIIGALNEGITGARTTKTLAREEQNFTEFSSLTSDMRNAAVKAAVSASLYTPIVMTVGAVTTAAVLAAAGQRVMFAGMQLGDLVFFIGLSSMFFEPVRQIAGIFAQFQAAQAAAERVVSLVEAEPGIVDTPEVTEAFGDMFAPKRENWPPLRGEITFEQVGFQYRDGKRVLDGMNLHFHAGEKIALVGQTGSGKSTIVNLICRFYEPTEGRILIDGVDYRERSQGWLHANLGYVLQTPHLFSGSIRENIRYGRPEADDGEIETASRLVGAHDFIEKLEQGYDTDVGEGGDKLSTGQKQLVSFARAILADPAIFVLDEATSSIDTETERRIQQAIDRVLHGRTSFIIAHRLSTIRSADRILVIEDGKILEQGDHHSLMRLRGHYYELYTNQFCEEREMQILSAEDMLTE